MPPADTWIVVTVRIPYILAVVVTTILLWIIVIAALTFRRNSQQIKTLNHRIEKLSTEVAESDTIVIRDAYLQFTYNISHEVSNPLQSIQTNLEIMADCSPAEVSRWKQYYAIIQQEIKRLSTLTEHVRLLSQLERGSGPIQREPLNLKSVIENVIMAQIERASAKNISIKYEGPNRPAKVLGNQEHLYQLIINLVDNSMKYSKESGGQIIITLEERDNFAHIKVRDNGIGIPEQDIPFVFDTAYRSPNMSSIRRPGSGLGLAIAKRIVEQHEGTVGAESILGEGTTITVDLPLYNPTS